MTTNWWETYCNTHANIDTITWNKFKAWFHTHYVPRGTMKLKKKEFANLKQSSMIVNEYLNSFIELSRYTPKDMLAFFSHKIICMRTDANCSLQLRVFQGIESIGKQ
jgi:hypothetical protein